MIKVTKLQRKRLEALITLGLRVEAIKHLRKVTKKNKKLTLTVKEAKQWLEENMA